MVPVATDTDETGILADGLPVLETTLVASEEDVIIDGSGTVMRAEVFNGAIPAPTIRVDVGTTVIVRLVNNLPHPTGIHWHGIELQNNADGTEVTQDGAAARPAQRLGDGSLVGGTFLYRFKVTRPGLYWYHPHHHNSLNRLFRGMYGMIVVTDPLESSLVGSVLPSETMQVVLGDVTVCKAPGSNDARTYVDPTTLPAADRAEWLSGATTQSGPTPVQLCEIAPAGSATNDDGTPATASYLAGDVPSGIRPSTNPRSVEGQTILTNGMNVGGRLGTPAAPRALVAGGVTPHPVQSGQGLRLQLVNCTVLRYFRLRLTYPDAGGTGIQVNLVRLGGEGGLLDRAVLEGGTTGTIDTGFSTGEILLPPATRADVAIAIPAGLPDGTVLTLWTRDYQRTGPTNPNNWAQLPTVPVMHFVINGAAVTAYTITGSDVNVVPLTGTALRTPAGMPATVNLSPLATSTLLAGPAVPARPPGFVNANITMNTSGGVPNVDGIAEHIMGTPTYAHAAHLGSSRYAEQDRVYELQVTNTTSAHHPFHLHGFSFQPISLAPRTGAPAGVTGSYTFPYKEFRDTIDIPRHRTLTFRVRTDARPLADGTTAGGALGRWLFHCHIFFHHEKGMISELVVTSADGRERPQLHVGGSWAYAGTPGQARREGKFHHPNGLTIATLTVTRQDGSPIGTVTQFTPSPSGTWKWEYNATAADTVRNEYVYVTATDVDGRKDQAVFRLQVGGTDNASDQGDPHLRTVNGVRYDFQAAGEFTLLLDREFGTEIQVRQTPVETPPPITDAYSGLTACVSLNTAVAVRLGSHRISFQPALANRTPEAGHRLFVNGKVTLLTREGLDLDGHRVTGFEAGDELALRVDFAHGAVLQVTPRVWTSYGIRYLDVNVSSTQADEGLIGKIAKGNWLPMLRNGASLGPRPRDLLERYVQLYRTLADSWRVTDRTSLFVYAPGTGTATFTDRDWPPPPKEKGEQPTASACVLKPGFMRPNKPITRNIDLEEARRICHDVKGDLHDACVFDVAATGDPEFARGYLVLQDLRRYSTRIHLTSKKSHVHQGEPLELTAIVAALQAKQPVPTGTITFVIEGAASSPPIKVDASGRATYTTTTLAVGDYKIRASYTPDGSYLPSTSFNLIQKISKPHEPKPTETPPTTTQPQPHHPSTLTEFLKSCTVGFVKHFCACFQKICRLSKHTAHGGHGQGGGAGTGGGHGFGSGNGGGGHRPGGAGGGHGHGTTGGGTTGGGTTGGGTTGGGTTGGGHGH